MQKQAFLEQIIPEFRHNKETTGQNMQCDLSSSSLGDSIA